MRLSDLTGREVINLEDGGRLGFIDECELEFEGSSGRINALMVPRRSWLSSLINSERATTIPWNSIKRIGEEVIIVDFNNAYEKMSSVFRGAGK